MLPIEFFNNVRNLSKACKVTGVAGHLLTFTSIGDATLNVLDIHGLRCTMTLHNVMVQSGTHAPICFGARLHKHGHVQYGC